MVASLRLEKIIKATCIRLYIQYSEKMKQRKLKFTSALLPGGWASDVTLTLGPQGMIQRIETGSADKTAKTLKGIAIPAVPNVHSHAHQRLMAGLAEVAG